MIEQLWEKLQEKWAWSSREIGPGIPYVSRDGIYQSKGEISWWTNGFYPGILWLLYGENGDEYYRQRAEEIENQ